MVQFLSQNTEKYSAIMYNNKLFEKKKDEKSLLIYG